MENIPTHEVSVVIPSWDGASHLARTLPTVLQQKNLSYEVIVVENGVLNDDTVSLVNTFQQNHANLHLVRIAKNTGYAGGVNAGIATAKNKLVAVLCNDNIADPYWLYELLLSYGNGTDKKSGCKIAAVMSQSKVAGINTELRGNLNFCGRNISYPDPNWLKESVPIFYPGGNAFLFDKTITALPFDPLYFTYQEDVALGWRLRNLGYQVLYTHRSIVNSFDGGTTKKMPYWTSFYSERNRLLNLLSFPQRKTILKYFSFWFFDFLLSILLGSNRGSKIQAALWIISHFPQVLQQRNKNQAERRVGDEIALSYLSKKYFSETKNSLLKKKCNSILERIL